MLIKDFRIQLLCFSFHHYIISIKQNSNAGGSKLPCFIKKIYCRLEKQRDITLILHLPQGNCLVLMLLCVFRREMCHCLWSSVTSHQEAIRGCRVNFFQGQKRSDNGLLSLQMAATLAANKRNFPMH